jgi:hypothetical protein
MKLGWKYEYWDGQNAHFPRHNVVSVSSLRAPVPFTWELRPVIPTDEPERLLPTWLPTATQSTFATEVDRIEAAARKISVISSLANVGLRCPLPAWRPFLILRSVTRLLALPCSLPQEKPPHSRYVIRPSRMAPQGDSDGDGFSRTQHSSPQWRRSLGKPLCSRQ